MTPCLTFTRANRKAVHSGASHPRLRANTVPTGRSSQAGGCVRHHLHSGSPIQSPTRRAMERDHERQKERKEGGVEGDSQDHPNVGESVRRQGKRIDSNQAEEIVDQQAGMEDPQAVTALPNSRFASWGVAIFGEPDGWIVEADRPGGRCCECAPGGPGSPVRAQRGVPRRGRCRRVRRRLYRAE